jgi:hypothetical protein
MWVGAGRGSTFTRQLMTYLYASAYLLAWAYTTYCVLMRNAAPTGHTDQDYYEREGSALLLPVAVLAGMVFPLTWFVWSAQADNETGRPWTLVMTVAATVCFAFMSVALPHYDPPFIAMQICAVLSGLSFLAFFTGRP